MRYLSFVVLFLIVPAFAQAGDVFQEKEIAQISLKAVDIAEPSATMRDDESNEAIVFIGDRIGADGWEVVDISVAAVTIQLGKQKMRLLKVIGFSEIE